MTYPTGKSFRIWLLNGLILSSLLIFYLWIIWLACGSDQWAHLDWIDYRKLFDIDDSWRFFLANALFYKPSIFLWNYILPVSSILDSSLSTLCHGNLFAVRCFHIIGSIICLSFIFSISYQLTKDLMLALLSMVMIALMPIYPFIFASFYGEALFAFMVTFICYLWVVKKNTLAIVGISLLPLIRPEGCVYVLLFGIYFGLKGEYKSVIYLCIPGFIYGLVLWIGLDSLSDMVSWRLALRETMFMIPRQSISQSALRLVQTLNPIMIGLWILCFCLKPYRWLWPIYAGPMVIIVFQLISVLQGTFTYELRYFFSAIPVWGICWTVPFGHVLNHYKNQQFPIKVVFIRICAIGLCLICIIHHSFQFDGFRHILSHVINNRGPVKGYLTDMIHRYQSNRTHIERLRLFADQVDSIIQMNHNIKRVFIRRHDVLYFLSFYKNGFKGDIVLIPYDSIGVSRYCEDHHFGYNIDHLNHSFYHFSSGDHKENALFIGYLNDKNIKPVVQMGPVISPGIKEDTLYAYLVSYNHKKSVRCE